MGPGGAVATSAAGRRLVHIEIPPELFDGDTRGFLQYLGLRGRHLMDNEWSIRADVGPTLVISQTLADETGVGHKFDVLKQLPNIDAIVNDPAHAGEWEDLNTRLMERFLGGCCRALKLPTMPSLSMHTKHGVVRRRDDGVLDMMPHLQGGIAVAIDRRDVQAGDPSRRKSLSVQGSATGQLL